MRSTTIRWIGALSFAAVISTSYGAVAKGQTGNVDLNGFVGRWEQNPDKSRGTISRDLTYTFTEEPDGFVSIVRGMVQLRDRVRFDGSNYPTPGVEGRSTSWTRVSDTVYETTIQTGKGPIARGRWTLSEDGTRLTQETTRTEPSPQINTIQYNRISGSGKSLIGAWEPVSSRTLPPESFVVTLSDAATLSVSFGTGVRYTMRPDGQEYEARNDGFPEMKAVVVALGPRSLRRTTFRGGSPMLEAVWTLSPDGRTLTVTSQPAGRSAEHSILLYERQDVP